MMNEPTEQNVLEGETGHSQLNGKGLTPIKIEDFAVNTLDRVIFCEIKVYKYFFSKISEYFRKRKKFFLHCVL